jgi:anti-anti-sigma regulatory factor
MDSSALGMVLLLKEHVDGDKKRLEVRNARPEVEKILRIANFDKLLELSCA